MLIDAAELDRKKMELRHTVAGGGEVDLAFRGRAYGTVVPRQQREAERAELAQLRKQVAELQQQLHTTTGQEVRA